MKTHAVDIVYSSKVPQQGVLMHADICFCGEDICLNIPHIYDFQIFLQVDCRCMYITNCVSNQDVRDFAFFFFHC